MGQGSSNVRPPDPPPAVEPPPKEVDASVRRARTQQRARTASAQGRRSTILTGAQGLPSAFEIERDKRTGKTLLGA